jgi:hypothetical protein
VDRVLASEAKGRGFDPRQPRHSLHFPSSRHHAIASIGGTAECLIFPTFQTVQGRIPWTKRRVSGLMIDVLTQSNATFETKIPVRTIEHATKLAFEKC